MEYREIGRTGLKASVMGFGGMRFFKHPEDQAIETVRRCLDRGITFFETGGYGDGKSEIVLGRALKGHRDKVTLANKAPVSGLPDGKKIRQHLEGALDREGVDTFDVFSFWGTNNREIFDNLKGAEGGMAALEKAKQEGLIRAIGITTHAHPETIVEFAKEYPLDCVTLKEHLLYSRQQETIAQLHEMGVGVVVMTPLAGGMIAQPSGEIRDHLAKSGYTAPLLALRYLTSNPGVTSVISGMESPEDVDENVAAGENAGPLTDTERDLIDYIRARMSGLGENFCTGCGYCMPCPEGVNIPGVFNLWNIMRGYGSSSYSKREYAKMIEQRHWADVKGKSAEHCVECGECLEKCPNQIPIIEELKQAHSDLTSED